MKFCVYDNRCGYILANFFFLFLYLRSLLADAHAVFFWWRLHYVIPSLELLNLLDKWSAINRLSANPHRSLAPSKWYTELLFDPTDFTIQNNRYYITWKCESLCIYTAWTFTLYYKMCNIYPSRVRCPTNSMTSLKRQVGIGRRGLCCGKAYVASILDDKVTDIIDDDVVVPE